MICDTFVYRLLLFVYFSTFLADHPLRVAKHGLQEFHPVPDFEDVIGDAHVDDGAAAVLTHAEDLVGYREGAVHRDRAAHPVVPAAVLEGLQVERQGCWRRERSAREAIEWRLHGERLVRSLGVVVVDPLVEFALGLVEGAEDLARQELSTERTMEAFDLARGGGRARLRESVRHAVLSTDLVEEHLGLVAPESVGEDLAVMREHFLGPPVTL